MTDSTLCAKADMKGIWGGGKLRLDRAEGAATHAPSLFLLFFSFLSPHPLSLLFLFKAGRVSLCSLGTCYAVDQAGLKLTASKCSALSYRKAVPRHANSQHLSAFAPACLAHCPLRGCISPRNTLTDLPRKTPSELTDVITDPRSLGPL